MRHVTSDDGTVLAVEEHGERGDGTVVVLLSGAFNDRSRLRPLAEALADRVAAVTVDRRARGDSTDASDGGSAGAVEREIADVRALVADLGGDVTLLGFSSGGQLALAAAAAGVPVARVVSLEAPFLPPDAPPRPDLSGEIADLVHAGQREQAVELYQRDLVGMTEEAIAGVKSAPFWPGLVAIAPSLVYDAAVTARHADPRTVAGLEVPVLAVRGRDAIPVLVAGADAVVASVPGARLALVDGVGHDPDLGQVADTVVEFVTHSPAT